MGTLIKALLASSVLILAGQPSYSAGQDDVNNVYRLGEMLKKAGFATGYEVSGWNQYLDIHTGSMLPGDAREISKAACQFAQQKMRFERPWEIRVFLVVGERPAATCYTK